MIITTEIFICDICNENFQDGFVFDGYIDPVTNGERMDRIISLQQGKPQDICLDCVKKLFKI